MRVVAARFRDREQATAALSRLQRRLPLGPDDVRIAPLGVPGEETDSETVLAGRFEERHAPEVDRVVRELGGEIVADVDERRTQPYAALRRTGTRGGSSFAHN